MISKPTIHGERITLRPLHPDDIDAYHVLLRDEEGLRLTGTQRRFTREDAEQWLASLAEREGRIDLGIVIQESGEVIGEVVLNQIDSANRSANIRIGLITARAGRGYGSEAMRLMLAHAFEALGLHRVELDVFAFNERAIHVYETLGFQREGVLRDVLYWDGTYHDAILMSMLETEYQARKAQRPGA